MDDAKAGVYGGYSLLNRDLLLVSVGVGLVMVVGADGARGREEGIGQRVQVHRRAVMVLASITLLV